MKKPIMFISNLIRVCMVLTLLFNGKLCEISSKEYGKSYLSTILYEGDTFGCVFYPRPHPKPLNDEYWRWDTCYWKNTEVRHYMDWHSFKDFYELNNEYLTFSELYAISKSNCIEEEDYDCNLTECLKLNPEIDYTGYATCSMSRRKQGNYILFYFEHSKLLKVWMLEWEEFLDYLKWDKEQGGTMEDYLLKNNWLNWDNAY